MTADKRKPRVRGDSLRIDRIVPMAGRLAFSTGSRSATNRRKWDRLIDELVDSGRYDLLRDIRDHRPRRAVIFDYWQRGALSELPSGKEGEPLVPAMRAWAETHEVGEDRRRQLKYDINHIERTARADATVADLPEVIEALRTTLGRKHHRAYNVVRSTALAFARVTCKRSSRLYREVAAAEPFSNKATRKPHPLTPAEMREVFPRPETDAVDAIAWGMATTGMGAKEYWGRWSVREDRVRIHGTKREGRDRAVPLVMAPVVPAIARVTFDKAVRARAKAIGRDVKPYDLRRTFAHWMEEARISRARRRAYMGHGKSDTTDIYESHEVDGFLVADAALLRAYLGLDDTTAAGKLRRVK